MADPARADPDEEGLASVELPLLLYDGDCGFCTRSVRWIERHVPGDARLEAWQFADLPALGIPAGRARREVLWVGRDRRVRGGAQAFASVLVAAGGWWAAAGTLLRIPPVRWIAHLGYRLVAGNRHRLPGMTPACRLPADRRPGALRPKG